MGQIRPSKPDYDNLGVKILGNNCLNVMLKELSPYDAVKAVLWESVNEPPIIFKRNSSTKWLANQKLK